MADSTADPMVELLAEHGQYHDHGYSVYTRDFLLASLHPLDRTDTWRTREGEVLRLEDMTPTHRRNLLRWLRRRPLALALGYTRNHASGPLAARGDHARDAEDEWLDGILEDPLAWLNDTPLVKRLEELQAAVPVVEAEPF